MPVSMMRDARSRPAIYYLLGLGEVSEWHRVDATEIWHYYAGAPMVITLSTNGHDAQAHHLGPNLLRGQAPQVIVPRRLLADGHLARGLDAGRPAPWRRASISPVSRWRRRTGVPCRASRAGEERQGCDPGSRGTRPECLAGPADAPCAGLGRAFRARLYQNAPTAPVPWGLMRRLWRGSARISRPCTGVTDRSRSFVSRLLPVQTTMPGWPGGAITGSSQPVSCGWRPCRISRRDRHPVSASASRITPILPGSRALPQGIAMARRVARACAPCSAPSALRRAFATLSHEGSACGYGLAVIERGAAGLFDIQVAGTLRGRGLGRFLVAAILAQARQCGAGSAWLQVLAANEAACALYRRLGFTPVHSYAYRVAP